MTFAHIGGLPVEEALAALPAAGARGSAAWAPPGIGEDAGMDTILAWLLPLVVFLVFLGILMRRRDGISGRDARLIIVAIVVCAAAAAALDVVL